MTREEILENIKILSHSQGFYSRMYKLLSEDSKAADEALTYLEQQGFSDPVDLVLFLET